MVGIISNTSALNAQSNLNRASVDSSSSIARLSSGNRISRAADDVAGLAVGTILQTNVSTLKAALSNTAQANSLLGVADGALKNIGDILQRQKALASQATSGSLTDQARSFLNQEFSNLRSQIDQIAESTNFNGIKLVDGSLFSPAELASNTSRTAVATSGSITFAGAMVDTGAITIQHGGASVTITHRSNANYAGTNASPLNINIGGGVNGFIAGGAGANDATNFMTAINNILNSTDTTAAVVSAKNVLSGITFTRSGATITMTSKAAGVYFNGTGAGGLAIKEANFTATTDVTVNGSNIATAYTALSAAGTAGTGNDTTTTPPVDGYLNAGSFNTTAGTAYGGTATTIAQGTVTDTLLLALDLDTAGSTGVNFSGVSNNADFVGTISGFQATYNQVGFADISITVGNYTYLAKNVNTAPTADTIVRFSSVEAGGGYFDLQFDDTTASGQTAITNQDDADAFANRLDQALSGVTAYQMRQVSSYEGIGAIYNNSGTSIGNLTGTNLNMFGSDFTGKKIEDIKVIAGAVTGSVQPVIEITIDGEVYRSGYDNTGVAANSFTIGATTVTLAASATMGFKSTTNPNNLLVFRNSGTALDLTNADNAAAVEAAFKQALGVGEGGSSLSFQVGTTSSESIAVQVQSARSEDIYLDNDGVSQELDISTLAGANAAGDVLDNAINTVTSIRAVIGALQSRFDYAAANINSGIQNQDAARSTYLDTDVAAESTAFAQAQVRVQASISVLAQANQLPQNLLKLIG